MCGFLSFHQRVLMERGFCAIGEISWFVVSEYSGGANLIGLFLTGKDLILV